MRRYRPESMLFPQALWTLAVILQMPSPIGITDQFRQAIEQTSVKEKWFASFCLVLNSAMGMTRVSVC